MKWIAGLLVVALIALGLYWLLSNDTDDGAQAPPDGAATAAPGTEAPATPDDGGGDGGDAPYIEILVPEEGATVSGRGEPIEVSGTGRGLGEGAEVQLGADTGQGLISTAPIEITGTDEQGVSTWEAVAEATLVEDTPGQISAYSPMPQEESDVDQGLRDTVRVVYDVTGGETYELEGTDWLLGRLMKEDISGFEDPVGEITARFEDGTVSGSGGCNSYSASYSIGTDGDAQTIEVGPISATEMACEPDVMAQEQLYFTQLGNARVYNVRGIELWMGNERGESVLIYNPVE